MRLVVVGTSRGGLSALEVFLSGLPRNFRLPIAIVQHRGKNLDATLARLLATCTTLPVSEPDDKELLEPGHVYIAPAGYHLLVEDGSVALSTEALVNHARPSVDVLFESAAHAYGRGVIGVILTGANDDGARGCARIEERGGVVVIQEPEGAEASAMPSAAIAATRVHSVLSLSAISAVLSDLAGHTMH